MQEAEILCHEDGNSEDGSEPSDGNESLEFGGFGVDEIVGNAGKDKP